MAAISLVQTPLAAATARLGNKSVPIPNITAPSNRITAALLLLSITTSRIGAKRIESEEYRGALGQQLCKQGTHSFKSQR